MFDNKRWLGCDSINKCKVVRAKYLLHLVVASTEEVAQSTRAAQIKQIIIVTLIKQICQNQFKLSFLINSNRKTSLKVPLSENTLFKFIKVYFFALIKKSNVLTTNTYLGFLLHILRTYRKLFQYKSFPSIN